MKTVILIIDTGIVHINPHIFRFYYLGAMSDSSSYWAITALYGVIQRFMPFFLIGQTEPLNNPSSSAIQKEATLFV